MNWEFTGNQEIVRVALNIYGDMLMGMIEPESDLNQKEYMSYENGEEIVYSRTSTWMRYFTIKCTWKTCYIRIPPHRRTAYSGWYVMLCDVAGRFAKEHDFTILSEQEFSKPMSEVLQDLGENHPEELIAGLI